MQEFENNLLSMGLFCDAECTVVFSKTDVKVFDKHNNLILQGFRETEGPRMWRFNLLPNQQSPLALKQLACNANAKAADLLTTKVPSTKPFKNSTEYHRRAYDLPSTKNLIEYLHCTVGSPVKRTLLDAVKAGNYRSFPGLSVANVDRYCPLNATPTVLGHLTQVPQGLRSTRWAAAACALLNIKNALLPSTELFNELTEPVQSVHIKVLATSKLFTDDMGRFPIRAMSGNQYIMLAFHEQANVILVQPFKTKADTHRIPAYNVIMTRLKKRNLGVDLQVLDNEASAAYTNCIENEWHCSHQKVPPDMHRRNKAERAIRTFKAHFIAILASVDPAFPRNRWDLLLPQAELTLNLLRQSALHPKISAWEHFNGPYNFDATPMGPPGCKVIAHAKGSTRLSWDYRGHIGFYVGPALDHYRCYTIIKSSTSAVIISDTVVFQHPTLSVPTLTTTDRIIHCLRALTVAVRADKTPDNCHAQLLAIESLRAIFNFNQPAPLSPPSVPISTNPDIPAPSPRVSLIDPPSLSKEPTSPPRVPELRPRMPESLPRVPTPTPSPTTERALPLNSQPIAHRTRSNLRNNLAASVQSENRVKFALPHQHRDTNSMTWRNNITHKAIRETVWITVPPSSRPPTSNLSPQSSQAIQPSSNRFSLLTDDDNPTPPTSISLTTAPTSESTNRTFNMSETVLSAQEKHIRKANLRKHRRKTLQQLAQSEDLFLTESIALANAERAASATSAPPISTTLSMHQKIAVLPTIATAYSVHQLFPPTGSAYPVLDHETGQTLEHRQLRRLPKYKKTWDRSYGNEFGRLCQGAGVHPTIPGEQRVKGTDTMRPINFHDIPQDRISDVAHTRVVCEVKPNKEEINRTRITIGGNTINYSGDCGTKTASLETIKLVINSTLSTPGAEYMTMDLSNFYLNTPLDRPEYTRIKLTDIPQEIVEEYKLHQLVHNGWIYFKISKGMYGLKQAGKLANDLLSKRLTAHGYIQCDITPGLWRHETRPVIFSLVVDDFGVQFTGRHNAEHLLSTLQKHYQVSTDWTGTKFAGMNLKWDYIKRTCRLTMDGYIIDVRTRFNHPNPRKPQHSPHKHRRIIYGAKSQLIVDDVDSSPLLDAKGIKHVQSIVGCLLFYARAVDNKLLCTLSSIGTKQATATENTLAECNILLDYLATYPNDGITYKASNMILAAHSDAGYLNESESRSRAGAHIFLSNDDPVPTANGPVLSSASILRSVYASAAEAELAALYKCAQDMVPLRHALNFMGWKQPKSPIQVDNSTAVGFANNTIISRRLKCLEMRLHWLKDREAQEQFRIFWDKGSRNNADYHTKLHPPEYHISHRPSHAG